MVSPRSHQCETFEGLLGRIGSFRHSDQQKRNNSSEYCVFFALRFNKIICNESTDSLTNEELRCLLYFFSAGVRCEVISWVLSTVIFDSYHNVTVCRSMYTQPTFGKLVSA